MSEFVICVNCGKQVKVDRIGSDERCYWCGETAQEQKGVNRAMATEDESRPAPPRPDVTGMTKGRKMHALSQYYAQNEEAIKADFLNLGERAMRKKWGISQSGWLVKRAQLFPDRFEPPNWKSRQGTGDNPLAKGPRKTRANKAPASLLRKTPGKELPAETSTEPPTSKRQESAEQVNELDYLRGWRDAAREFLKAMFSG